MTFERVRSNVDNLPKAIGNGFRPPTAGYGLSYGEFFVQTGHPIDEIIGYRSIDENGDLVTAAFGPATPDFKLGWTNDFTFRRLNLSMLWDWQKGGWAQNQTKSLYDCNILSEDAGRPSGAARVAACLETGLANPFVERTTYLRLRELRLAYALPTALSRWVAGGQDVQVSLTGRNLYLDTKYWGYDPESSNFGQQAITRNIDLGPYPPSRQFFFSISAGF